MDELKAKANTVATVPILQYLLVLNLWYGSRLIIAVKILLKSLRRTPSNTHFQNSPLSQHDTLTR